MTDFKPYIGMMDNRYAGRYSKAKAIGNCERKRGSGQITRRDGRSLAANLDGLL